MAPQPFTIAPTILVTDDDTTILQLVISVLLAEGYLALAAASPLQALYIAEQCSTPLDLLVSDIQMPLMDGPTLWEAVKRWHPRAKLVLMSGSSPLLTVPCVPFLSKPFTVSQLTAKIRIALRPGRRLSAGQRHRALDLWSSEMARAPEEGMALGRAELRGPRAAGPGNRGTDDAV